MPMLTPFPCSVGGYLIQLAKDVYNHANADVIVTRNCVIFALWLLSIKLAG